MFPSVRNCPKKRKLRQRGKKKVKKADSDRWQKPMKTATPQVAQKSQPIKSRNLYEGLAEEPTPETAEIGLNPPEKDQASGNSRKSTQPPRQSGPSSPRRKKRREQRQTEDRPGPADAQVTEEEVEAQQVYDRPHQASYFIPGRVEGRPVQFLLDTGCTTNLLGKHVFDRLPDKIKAQKEEYSRHGLLADGTRLPFYGILKLNVRLRQVKTEVIFIVSQINEDAILGMPFLVERRCAMDFHRPILRLDGHEVKCTDRQGRLLANNIQAIRGEVLPPETEKTIMCRVTSLWA